MSSRVCGSMPVVMKSLSSPSPPMTPRAPNPAPVSSAAETTIRVSTLVRSRSEEIAMTASSRSWVEPGSAESVAWSVT